MDNNICLIIQGLSGNVKKLKEKYNGSNIKIIFSTWEGEEGNYNKDDIVIYNKYPKNRGIQNIMLQKISTYNGLLKAKELGYKYAIKIRSDMYFTNIDKFIKCNIDYNKLNFLFFLDYYRHDHKKYYKYFCDYIQISSVDNLLKMWDFTYKDVNYAEELITFFVIKYFTKDQINFIGNLLNKDNDIYWIKNKFYLSSLNNNDSYKITYNI